MNFVIFCLIGFLFGYVYKGNKAPIDNFFKNQWKELLNKKNTPKEG